VYVAELAPSSVNFNVYFWTAARQANVLGLIDSVTTGIKTALDGANIDMPYPQLVIHREREQHKDSTETDG
jgi:small-conductance mechanosensitive channel